MNDETDDDRCEFNELALVDLGVSPVAWRAMTAGERIALMTRWFNSYPPRTRRQARELLGVTFAQWAELGSAGRYNAGLIVERLGRVMRPKHISTWLTKPIEALDFDKPIDVIARGDHLRVARLISALEDPEPASRSGPRRGHCA